MPDRVLKWVLVLIPIVLVIAITHDYFVLRPARAAEGPPEGQVFRTGSYAAYRIPDQGDEVVCYMSTGFGKHTISCVGP